MDTLLVLPKKSRYDELHGKPLVGPAGDLVREAVGPCDVLYAKDYNHALPGYKFVILTGDESLNHLGPHLKLNLHRGFVHQFPGRNVVATYWPQDCVDLQNYEASRAHSMDDDDEEDAKSNGKDGGETSRANYRFWFMRDVEKLRNPPPRISFINERPTNLQSANLLKMIKGRTIYFDIESHPDNYITCFSYAIDDGPVCTHTVYFKRQLQDASLELMAGLARAFMHNKIVIHNAGFDLMFLALFHNIPFGPDIEDTMLMGHRIWPEAEKSLAHNITLWTNEPYHKDSGGTWNPQTKPALDNLLRYNAKDVATLRAIHKAQWRYVDASGDPGLRRSIVQVNTSIFNYLYAGLHGLPINGLKLAHYLKKARTDRDQWARVVQVALGYNMNPGSSQQLADYFNERLHYPVHARTKSGAPKCDESTLYRYLLKYHNPAVRLILKYKGLQKLAGELGFQAYTKPLNFK